MSKNSPIKRTLTLSYPRKEAVMKKITLIAVIFLTLFSWRLFPDDRRIQEIDSLLTTWHHAAAVADEKAYFGAMSDDFVFLGTDATERWNKKEFLEWSMKFFQRDSAWVFKARSRHINFSGDGNTAWFDELLDSKSYWLTRGSGVLTRTKSGWKLRQYNMALTIPNESVRHIRPFVEKAFKKKK